MLCVICKNLNLKVFIPSLVSSWSVKIYAREAAGPWIKMYSK